MALATKKQRPSTWNPADKASRLFIVLPENQMQLQQIRTPRTPRTPKMPRTPRTPRTPKVSASNQAMTKRATFSGTVNIFTSQPPYLPIISEGSIEDSEGGWVRSPMHQQLLSPRPPLPPLPVETEAPEELPNFLSIPRPEELTKRPPYWLIVRQESRQKVTVDGSHAPSMRLLAEYLNKWCRGEITLLENRPMMVDIKLHDCPFGLGVLKDRLVLETTGGRELSAVLVLAFAEKILKYDMVDNGGSGPNVWQFKRTRAFK